jgi:hypothetical protein
MVALVHAKSLGEFVWTNERKRRVNVPRITTQGATRTVDAAKGIPHCGLTPG